MANVARKSWLASVRIGWIGVGNMGLPMVKNLLKHDAQGNVIESLTVYDANEDKRVAAMNELSSLRDHVQVSETNSVRDMNKGTNRCDVVFSMLPDGKALSLCVEQLLESLSASPGLKLVVDCSTVHPEDAKRAAAKLDHAGVAFLDAPVSGGIQAAKNGTLSFLAGGAPTTLEAARPFLQKMGGKILHCGSQPGLGQAAKLANNLLLGITMAGLCESFKLGASFGLEPKALSEVFNASSGRCWSSEKYSPVAGIMDSVPANVNYKTGFAARLMLKDLKLALHSDSSLRLPLGAAAMEQYARLAEQHPDLDFSALYKYPLTKEVDRD